MTAKLALLASCLLAACHSSRPTAVPVSLGLFIEPAAVVSVDGQALLGARLTNRADGPIAVCSLPVVEAAEDALSGQVLITTEFVSSSSHPRPEVEELCPSWDAFLLQPGQTTTLATSTDSLGARCLNLTLHLRYWTLRERKPVDVEPHFRSVGIRAAESLRGRGDPVSSSCR